MKRVMSDWRQKAFTLFPKLRRELEQPDYSLYDTFFDLL